MSKLERSNLYQDVWSRPCTKIAAVLGISSSALKRICTEMDIPTPVAGYWTRVQCGKPVTKDPLPKARKETELTWDVDLENSKRQKTEQVRKEKEEQEAVEMVKAMDMPEITIAAVQMGGAARRSDRSIGRGFPALEWQSLPPNPGAFP